MEYMSRAEFLAEVKKRGMLATSKISTAGSSKDQWVRMCCATLFYWVSALGISVIADYDPILGEATDVRFPGVDRIPRRYAFEMLDKLPFGEEPTPNPKDIEIVTFNRGSSTNGRYNVNITVKNNTPRNTHAFIKAVIDLSGWHGVYEPISANKTASFTFTLPKIYFQPGGKVQTGIITVTDSFYLISTPKRAVTFVSFPPGAEVSVV